MPIHLSRAVLWAAALLLSATHITHAQLTKVIALSGDTVPEGNGEFFSFGVPTLNDLGQAAFISRITNVEDEISFNSVGIYRSDGTTSVNIARARRAAPGGEMFADFQLLPAINDLGQTEFSAPLNISGTSPIFRGDGLTLVLVAKSGQTAPDGNGNFSSFSPPATNNAGQTAFYADLSGTTGPSPDAQGVFRNDGATTVQIGRAGQTAPDGDGTFIGVDQNSVSLNSVGQVAFASDLGGTSGSESAPRGVYRGSGAALTQIVRTGQSAPDGSGTFARVFNNSINDLGQVAIIGFIDTPAGSDDETGIYRGDGVTLTQIARQGQAAPDGNGTFNSVNNTALNNVGQLLVSATLAGSAGGGFGGNTALYRGDGTLLTPIVRSGQSTPDGTALFGGAGPSSINDAGQVAFFATLLDTDGAFQGLGIYFYDDALGLLTVAQTGDSMLGSTINFLDFNNVFPSFGDEYSELNNLGQVVYNFGLEDGRSGIAIWTVPEPSSLSLIVWFALAVRRQRGE